MGKTLHQRAKSVSGHYLEPPFEPSPSADLPERRSAIRRRP